MASLEVFYFVVLTVVSMSHVVVPSEPTSVRPTEYAVTELSAAEHLDLKWTLKHYSLLPRTELQCFRSPYFHTKNNDVQWTLKFCPSQNSNSYSGKLYLISNSLKHADNIGLVIDGEVSIFKGALRLRDKKISEQVRIGQESIFDFQIYGSNLPGWDDAADEMTIRCDFDMQETITKRINVEEPRKAKIIHEPQKGKLNADFGRLLKEEKFSDIEIIVGNESLSAHEIVLATRSPVFADLLERIERNDTGKLRVIIENMEPVVMAAILEYIYTDDVANVEEFPSIFGLLSAADEFKLPQLKTMCETVLHERLDADHAADILVFTDRYGLNKLKIDAMEFIRNHFPDVMETEGYKKMKDKSPALLMEILFSATDKRF